MSGEETIAAISTPIGLGGIGIVRLSGPKALSIMAGLADADFDALTSRRSHTTALTRIINPMTGDLVDEALVTIMRAPNSYTREDVVEINCHSATPVLRQILNLTLTAGARLAEPGEFTKRAFLSGRIDLTQARAVSCLIEAQSDAAARAAAAQAHGHVSAQINAYRQELVGLAAELEAALDFSDEDIGLRSSAGLREQIKELAENIEALLKRVERGRFAENGITAAIVGRPNVGKSSLLNALAMEDKAIVSAQPGTTRDIVESRIVFGDIPVHIKDTAGWRVPSDDIEAQGIGKTRNALETADIVLLILDGSEPLQEEDRKLIGSLSKSCSRPIIVVFSKNDLPQCLAEKDIPDFPRNCPIVSISATAGCGIDQLSAAVIDRLGLSAFSEGSEAIVAGIKQEQSLVKAGVELREAYKASTEGFGEEVVSQLVKDAIVDLGKFCGEDVGEEILDEIFSRFCIGK